MPEKKKQTDLAEGFGWVIKIVELLPPNGRAAAVWLALLLAILWTLIDIIVILERQGITVPVLFGG